MAMNPLRLLPFFPGACLAAAAFLSTALLAGAETPATMRAAVIHDGSVKIESVSVPTPGPGQVRVKVHAVGVNPVDWKRAMGGDGKVAGRDLAGVIDSVGPSAGDWKAGDAVIGVAANGTGSYAEYALVAINALAHKPEKLSFEDAASLPVVGETAYRALVVVGDVKEGQRVLIHGGAGGVGSMAVQLAKARGAHVIATASARNHEFLKSLGADETIDYNTTRFEDAVKAQSVDFVLNTANAETNERSIGVVKPGGILVSIVGAPPAEACKAAGIRGAVTGLVSGEMLPHVVKLVDDGKLRVQVEQRLPLAEAAKAWEQSRTGHTRGKIILVVAPAD